MNNWYVQLKVKDLSRAKGEVFYETLQGFRSEEAARNGAWDWIDEKIWSGIAAVQITFQVCRGATC